jgi:hypothetical protein
MPIAFALVSKLWIEYVGGDVRAASGVSRVHSRPATVLGARGEAVAASGLLPSRNSTSMLEAPERALTCDDRRTPPSSLGQSTSMVRKNLGLFSSSADQQEQPFIQVNAHRSIWIKWQRLAAVSIGWRKMLMSF